MYSQPSTTIKKKKKKKKAKKKARLYQKNKESKKGRGVAQVVEQQVTGFEYVLPL
jgi:hypothetical protein